MKTSTRLWLDTAFYVVVFLLLQLGASLALMAIYPDFSTNAVALALSSAVSSLLTIALFAALRWSPFSRAYLRSRPWVVLAWVCVLAFGTLIPSEWILELMGVDLGETEKNLFRQMFSTPWGYVAVGLLVPLAEEMVFRGALLRVLLILGVRWTANRAVGSKNQLALRAVGKQAIGVWGPIVLSALVFALIHGNLAQGIHAFLIGLLLGWLYWRTDSIVPGVVFHWVNNSVAYAQTRLFPWMEDMTLVEICGGSRMLVWLYLLFSLMLFLPALYQLHLRLRRPSILND